MQALFHTHGYGFCDWKHTEDVTTNTRIAGLGSYRLKDGGTNIGGRSRAKEGKDAEQEESPQPPVGALGMRLVLAGEIVRQLAEFHEGATWHAR